jgi:RNA polymerase sigma factor (sigma-70 family)
MRLKLTKSLKNKINVATTNNNLNELIAEYQPRLKSFIRKRVADKADAEDILQDVFYQLAKTTSLALNPIEHVSGWLYRVARNIIINKGIKKREEELPVYHNDDSDDEVMQDFSEILFGGTSQSPETEYLRSLVWTELETALAELPPEQREIFELTELDRLSVKEISEAMDVPVNTLLSRKHYAIMHLRKRLSGLYAEIVYS